MVSDDADDSESGADSETPDDLPNPSDPRKADHYRHRNGTDEIVFAVEEGHVLSVREYASIDEFERAVADADRVGTHEGVADLPGVAAFEDEAEGG